MSADNNYNNMLKVAQTFYVLLKKLYHKRLWFQMIMMMIVVDFGFKLGIEKIFSSVENYHNS